MGSPAPNPPLHAPSVQIRQVPLEPNAVLPRQLHQAFAVGRHGHAFAKERRVKGPAPLYNVTPRLHVYNAAEAGAVAGQEDGHRCWIVL